MAISIGDAVLKITGDTKGLDRSLNDANRNTASMAQKMQKSLLPVGAAFTAIGAAGLAMVSSTKKINAQLGVTAINLGVTTKEMRALTLATTNVTFSIDEVTKTFDLLARAGVKDQEIMKDVATAFDTLGDAIGIPASLVTAKLIPAMKTFDVSAEEMAEKTDALTYLFRNTTVSLDDFNRMVGYVTPDLVAMGLTTEDMIAILAELEEQGYSGEVMTREFRKAVTLARNEQITLNEALGISTETIDAYKVELEGATGLTQEYADVANTQYTILDKLKQKWSELTLQASGFLEPLEPILAAMTALGPMMMFFGTSMGAAAAKTVIATAALVAHAIAAKVAAAAQWLWNAALTANPIGVIIMLIAALIAAIVFLVKNWDKVKEVFTKVWDWIVEKLGVAIEKIKGFFTGLVDFVKSIPDKIKGFFKGIGDKISDHFSGLKEKVGGHFESMGDKVKNIMEKLGVDTGQMGAAMEEALGKHGTGIRGKMIAAFQGMKVGVKGILEKMGIDTNELMERIKGIIGGLQDKFNAVIDFFKGLPERVGNIFRDVWNALATGMLGALNWIVDKLNWLIGKINWIPEKLGLPTIPEISGIALPTGLAGVARESSLGVPSAQGTAEEHFHFHVGAMMGSKSEARSFVRYIHPILREETRTRAVGIKV